MNHASFPIDEVIPQLQDKLQQHKNVVLVAAPGAGKTTRVPIALMDEAWLSGKKILMLEPRRIATRNAARFMAQQLGQPCGETVGYRMRSESVVRSSTRVEVITEGVTDTYVVGRPGIIRRWFDYF